ncbi:MAG: carboxymuconolactone decarboxylase family protein [Xanthomonadaceae bacterium]|nr:carboxymuconolactone decarboxylase family protein [Xanthomonadaceae bacterium]
MSSKVAQLPLVEPEDADPIAKQVYDDAQARFQMVLNIFKVTGHAPEMAKPMWDIFFEILAEGQVDWYTKELLILKSTNMGDCLYCVTQHEVVAERLGVTPEKQKDIVGQLYKDSPHYSDKERAILDLCSHMCVDPEGIPADVWTKVKSYYDDGQIVEIVATVGAYIQVSKFGDALGVQLEAVFAQHQPRLFAREAPKSPAARKHLKHFLDAQKQA